MKKGHLSVFVFSLVVLCLLSPARILRAQGKSSLPIMPLPAHAVLGEGEFPIDGNLGIALKGYKEPRLERAQQRFFDMLSRETGIPLWREAILNAPNFIIQTAGPSAAVQQLGEDESYRLEISTTGVQLWRKPARGPSRTPDRHSEKLQRSRRYYRRQATLPLAWALDRLWTSFCTDLRD